MSPIAAGAARRRDDLVTEESASGAYRCCASLLERRYGVHPAYVEESHPLSARVARGIRRCSLAMRQSMRIERFPPTSVTILGRLWHEWTGDQTVFAVWAARREAYDRDPAGRARVHARAHRRLHVVAGARAMHVVARAQRVDAASGRILRRLLRQSSISCSTPPRRAGLAAYCRELVAIGAIAHFPSALPEVADVLLASLLDRAASGGRLSFEEGVRLYEEARPCTNLGAAAHARRMQMYPHERS